MAEKITKQLIEELVAEEIDKLDEEALNKLLNEVGMFAGIGQAIKGMAGDVKGKFQQHRALPVAQKLAAKHAKNLLDVTTNFVGVEDNFNADYQKWSKNPFIKKILDGIEFSAAMEQAASGVQDVIVKLDAVTSGEVGGGGGAEAGAGQAPADQKPAAGKEKTTPEVDPKVAAAMKASTSGVVGKQAKDLEQSKASAQMRKQSTGPSYPQPPKPTEKPVAATGTPKAPEKKSAVAYRKTVQEQILKKIRAILSENKKVRIISSNG